MAEIADERKRELQELVEAEERRITKAVEHDEADDLMAEGIYPIDSPIGEIGWGFPQPRRRFTRQTAYDRAQALGLAVVVGSVGGAMLGGLVAVVLALVALLFGVDVHVPPR